jgi:hypothetical protein
MPLTSLFRDTVMARIARDPEFATCMLLEGVSSLLNGDVDVGKDILRDYINATLGFENLGRMVDVPSKSLMRMFGPNGNPQTKNLIAVIAALKNEAGIDFEVASISKAKPSARRVSNRGRAQKRPALKYPERGESVHQPGFAEEPRPFKRR